MWLNPSINECMDAFFFQINSGFYSKIIHQAAEVWMKICPPKELATPWNLNIAMENVTKTQ